MRSIKKLVWNGMIIYAIILGMLVCLLANNDFFLSFVENSVETCFDPLKIKDWIWMFIGG